MIIHLTPVRHTEMLALRVEGETLFLNGEALDLAAIPEGATLPKAAVNCKWIAKDIERRDGEIQLTLILPHGANAPAETLQPQTIRTDEDGDIALPPYDTKGDEK